MDSRLPLPSSEYWYLGSPNPAVDELFRRLCLLAWPYALYCATRYLHDIHAAYDLMDAAVSNTEQYYARFQGERTSTQLFYRIVSVLKRLSKQRVQNNREVFCGSLDDLEVLATALLTIRSRSDGVHGSGARTNERTLEANYLLASGRSQLAADRGRSGSQSCNGSTVLPERASWTFGPHI